jgi:hypothetical protein
VDEVAEAPILANRLGEAGLPGLWPGCSKKKVRSPLLLTQIREKEKGGTRWTFLFQIAAPSVNTSLESVPGPARLTAATFQDGNMRAAAGCAGR